MGRPRSQQLTPQVAGQRSIPVNPAWIRLGCSGMLEATAPNVRFDVFRPLVLGENGLSRPMDNFNYGAVMRLKRGAAVEQGLAEINVVQARFPFAVGALLCFIPARRAARPGAIAALRF